MKNTRQIIIFSLLFIAWLPLLAVLWPYPTNEVAKNYHNALNVLLEKSSVAVEELKNKKGIELKETKEAIEHYSSYEDFHNLLQFTWLVRALLFIFGTFSVVYAYKQRKGWKYILAGASLAYLVFGYSLEWGGIFTSHYWLFLWQLATESEIWSIGAMYRELLFPVFHVVLIFAIFISLFMHKSDLTSHSAGTR